MTRYSTAVMHKSRKSRSTLPQDCQSVDPVNQQREDHTVHNTKAQNTTLVPRISAIRTYPVLG